MAECPLSHLAGFHDHCKMKAPSPRLIPETGVKQETQLHSLSKGPDSFRGIQDNTFRVARLKFRILADMSVIVNLLHAQVGKMIVVPIAAFPYRVGIADALRSRIRQEVFREIKRRVSQEVVPERAAAPSQPPNPSDPG